MKFSVIFLKRFVKNHQIKKRSREANPVAMTIIDFNTLKSVEASSLDGYKIKSADLAYSTLFTIDKNSFFVLFRVSHSTKREIYEKVEAESSEA